MVVHTERELATTVLSTVLRSLRYQDLHLYGNDSEYSSFFFAHYWMDVVTAEQHSMEEKGRTPPATGNPMLGAFRDSIRRIKVQKQRPGFDRMAQTLKTHHQISDVRAIKEQLDEAVKEGLLLTVWTKGLQCYKDPESLRSLRKFSVASLADARRAVKQAVREIGDPEGSKLAVIENYVGHSYV